MKSKMTNWLKDTELSGKFVTLIQMEKALPLEVPVKVDVGIGGNWLEAH